MFPRTRVPTPLELEVDRAIRELKHHAIGSEEYVKTLNSIVQLHKMKEEEKPSSVSKDTLAIIGANLTGIFMILKHENVHVITSKAMNFILRAR